MRYAIETRNLSKKFKGMYAVNKLNLHVPEGSIYGVIREGSLVREVRADQMSEASRDYVVGACVAGLIAGKSFALGDGGTLGLVTCVLSKAALMGVFVPLYVAVAVFFKQRLWLTLIGAFGAVGNLFLRTRDLA